MPLKNIMEDFTRLFKLQDQQMENLTKIIKLNQERIDILEQTICNIINALNKKDEI
jgi:hypothetical protein